MSEPDSQSPPRNRLILSIHVPKTAGTRFSDVLRNHYGSALAFYYGETDDRTHPLLRVPIRDLTTDMLDALADGGVEVLHGHIPARHLVRLVPNPKQYYLFLREPIEHALSRFHFVRDLPGDRPQAKAFKEAGTLENYIAIPRSQNFQSTYIAPLDIREVGFVGVTELFEQMLSLIDLADTSKRANVNANKPIADVNDRMTLAPHLTEDIALYSLALELAVRRLGVRDIKPAAGYKASVARLARRFGAP